MALKPATIDPVDTKATAKPKKGSHASNRVLALGVEPLTLQRTDPAVEHAAVLFATDPTRFQRYFGLMKNFVKSPFRLNKRNASHDGDKQSFSKSAGDSAKIATVAKALDIYGDDQLAKLHDNGQLDNMRDTGLRSAEIRDPYAQKKVRDKSTSKHKDKKEAAHYAGLDVVCKMNEKLPPQHRMAAEAMKKAFNLPDNFTMAMRSTNDPHRGLHGIVDRRIVEALDGLEVRLTKKEKKRVVQIVEFCQKKEFQAFMVENGGDQLYAKFRATIKSIDSKLWDARQDQRELQGPTVTAHLKADGSPDRRYKENKAPRESDLKPRDSQAAPTSTPLKQDGAVDQRDRAVKTESAATKTSSVSTPASASVPSSTHLKKDGTPDKRYADNRQTPELAVAAVTAPVVPITIAVVHAQAPAPNLPPTPTPTPSSPISTTSASREILTGPRGGTYYVNSNGNKTYTRSTPAPVAPVAPVSVAVASPAYSAPSYSSSSSTSSVCNSGGGGGHQTFTGPRGGTYYINSSGNKSYCR